MISHERPGGWLLFVLLAGIIAVAVAVRIAWAAYANVNPLDGRLDDSVFYFLQADGLAHHLAYRNLDGSFTAHWPPGYPLVLSGMFAVTGTHLLAAKALNVALSGATVLLTYTVGARAFGARVGLVAALLLALAPGHVYFSTMVMAEVLFSFGFLAVVALVIWWTIDVASVTWPRTLALGIATGCLALVRAEAVFLPAVFFALRLFLVPRWRPLLWCSAVFGVGFVLALTPWTVRNYVRFHEVIPLRDGSQSGLSNGLDPDYLHRGDRFTAPGPPLSETAGYMARHPWELVPLETDKLRYLYRNDSDGIAWLQHDNRPLLTASEVRRWSRVADWYFFVLGACAIAAVPRLARAPDRRRLVLAYMIVAWTAVLIIAWPETRYHLPIVSLLCMFAASTLVSAVGWVAARAR